MQRSEAIDRLVAACETAKIEAITLAPFLSGRYHANTQAVAEKCKQALKDYAECHEWGMMAAAPLTPCVLYYPPITKSAHPSNDQPYMIDIGVASQCVRGFRRPTMWAPIPTIKDMI